MKPTKTDVEYLEFLPTMCCAHCSNSSLNSYDDLYCTKLDSDDCLVNAYGRCILLENYREGEKDE